VLTIYRPTTT